VLCPKFQMRATVAALVLFQWMSQLLKGSYENWAIKHSMVVYSGPNTEYKSSEPLKTYIMLFLKQ